MYTVINHEDVVLLNDMSDEEIAAVFKNKYTPMRCHSPRPDQQQRNILLGPLPSVPGCSHQLNHAMVVLIHGDSTNIMTLS